MQHVNIGVWGQSYWSALLLYNQSIIEIAQLELYTTLAK